MSLSGRLLNPAAMEFVPSFTTHNSSSSFPNLANLADLPEADPAQTSDLSSSAPAESSPLACNGSSHDRQQVTSNGAHSAAETENGSSDAFSGMTAGLREMADALNDMMLSNEEGFVSLEDEAATIAQFY